MSNYHLTIEQKGIIKFLLFQGQTPEKIINDWNVEYHKREAPSIQTIYKIKRKMDRNNTIDVLKKCPKTKSILTPEKLDDIDKETEKTPFITFDSLSKKVKLPKTTTK